MKVKIEIDCTPAEAREFFGLPDIRDIQQKVLDATEQRFMDHIEHTDIQKMMDLWMPKSAFDPSQMQNFWNNMTNPVGKKDG